jgi:hypothetical protein
VQGETLFALSNDLISPSGQVFFGEAKREDIAPLPVVCPHCNQETAGQVCGECGAALSYRLQNKDFLCFSKRSVLRNLISELKHIRQRKGLFSGDAEADYLAAFSAFKEDSPKLYENTFTLKGERGIFIFER